MLLPYRCLISIQMPEEGKYLLFLSAPIRSFRRDGRVVECGGLENRCSAIAEPGVRIPLSPQSLMNPAFGGIIYFTEVLKKACFRKGLKGK
jgi:hypothetical protein